MSISCWHGDGSLSFCPESLEQIKLPIAFIEATVGSRDVGSISRMQRLLDHQGRPEPAVAQQASSLRCGFAIPVIRARCVPPLAAPGIPAYGEWALTAGGAPTP